MVQRRTPENQSQTAVGSGEVFDSAANDGDVVVRAGRVGGNSGLFRGVSAYNYNVAKTSPNTYTATQLSAQTSVSLSTGSYPSFIGGGGLIYNVGTSTITATALVEIHTPGEFGFLRSPDATPVQTQLSGTFTIPPGTGNDFTLFARSDIYNGSFKTTGGTTHQTYLPRAYMSGKFSVRASVTATGQFYPGVTAKVGHLTLSYQNFGQF